MSLDIHVYIHYPPDTTVVNKLDEIIETVKITPEKLAELTEKLKQPTEGLDKAVIDNPKP